jgi:hypothetical protein
MHGFSVSMSRFWRRFAEHAAVPMANKSIVV